MDRQDFTFSIPYGQGTLPLTVPEEHFAGSIFPYEQTKPEADPAAVVREALGNPIGSERLRVLAQGKRRVVIITSDQTRPMPSAITLPILIEEIRRGNPAAEITVLIAQGMHRPMTDEEMRARFGEALLNDVTFVVHDSKDDAGMTELGQLPSGGRLLINRIAAECDLLVAEGFIEPHFFAGFSGGRKSILPGISSYRTVMYNHNSAFIDHPKARHGFLEGNPIHRDMIFAAKKANLAFILNVLLDREKNICRAFAGDCEKAHLAGCAACAKGAVAPAVPAEIVVTSNGGAPLDQNIYQAVKGMATAANSVLPGGTIIMCAEGADGAGGKAFVEWFERHGSVRETMDAILAVPATETVPDQWQSQVLARVLLKADCIFVTREENRPIVESLFMTWAPDAETALRMALDRSAPDAKVTVIPSGVDVIVREGEE